MLVEPEIVEFMQSCGVDAECDFSRLERLYGLLVAANELTNLTRVTDREDYWIRHVADSLSVGRVCPELLQQGCGLRVADVGCGGGFPILPLACVNPQLDITGIECRGKKTQFIADAARELGLANVNLLTAQSREAGRAADHAGKYDVVLMRAVGESGEMLKEVKGLVSAKTGSRIINYKTPQAVAREKTLLEREAGKFGFDIVESSPFELPCGGGARQFVILVRKNG